MAVVDAESPDIDLAPLGDLLANQAVMKVFHAARQDIEIFVLRFGDVPRPLFDTQIAAMVAGFGEQVGYDALVAALTGGSIDKAHRFSDWSARPLSASQITYAAADVTHLREVYTRLRERLERDHRLDWVAEEMADLADPAKYRADPDAMWERLRPRSSNRRFLGMVRALAAWREREAAARVNTSPASACYDDETLLEIACHRRRTRRTIWPVPAASAAALPRAAPAHRCSPPSPRPRPCRKRRFPRCRAAAKAPGHRPRWCRC